MGGNTDEYSKERQLHSCERMESYYDFTWLPLLDLTSKAI